MSANVDVDGSLKMTVGVTTHYSNTEDAQTLSVARGFGKGGLIFLRGVR